MGAAAAPGRPDAADTRQESVLPTRRSAVFPRSLEWSHRRPHRCDQERHAQSRAQRPRRFLRLFRVDRRPGGRQRAVQRRRHVAPRSRVRHDARTDEPVGQRRLRSADREQRHTAIADDAVQLWVLSRAARTLRFHEGQGFVGLRRWRGSGAGAIHATGAARRRAFRDHHAPAGYEAL